MPALTTALVCALSYLTAVAASLCVAQVLLVGNEIAPADFLRSWDNDNSRTLSKFEFLAHLRKMFNFEGGPPL